MIRPTLLLLLSHQKQRASMKLKFITLTRQFTRHSPWINIRVLFYYAERACHTIESNTPSSNYNPSKMQIPMKLGKTAASALVLAGIGLILSGLYVRTLDSGSCPANMPRCYHTFPNTNIYITPTGNSIIEIGIVFIMLSIVVLLYNQTKNTRLKRDFAIAILGGLVLLGVSALATRTPWGSSNGFPLTYSFPISGCGAPNPFNGCGYYYDTGLITLDYLFWTALAFALVFILDTIRIRLKPLHPANVSRSEPAEPKL